MLDTRRWTTIVLRALPLAAVPLICLCNALKGSTQVESPEPTTSTIIGQELPGLSAAQQSAFDEGRKVFTESETRADGLGPVFNGTACAECHNSGAVGGAGSDLSVAIVTRIGGMQNGVYSDLANVGGPVLQARSLKEFDTSCPIEGEVVPAQAEYVSHRYTTPLFGAGLIAAIPAQTIIARTQVKDPDGVAGEANYEYNPETHQTELGRFGWKAQHSSLHLFAGDAYLNEMGVTSPTFPTDNLPQGRPIPYGWDTLSEPEDNGSDIQAFTNFMNYLAPPGRRLPITGQIVRGEALFTSLRCTACHIPAMNTGPNSNPAFANQTVRLYSDLLLHRLGPQLSDGIHQGQADGTQFRTAPLWGLSRRHYFLHDARAQSPLQAIMYHAGEATLARQRFQHLSTTDRADVLAFLDSL